MKKQTLLLLTFLFSLTLSAQEANPSELKNPKYKPELLSGLKLRSIGPALTSGRIADIAVNPEKHSEFYIAAAAGGVWKTSNAGYDFRSHLRFRGFLFYWMCYAVHRAIRTLCGLAQERITINEAWIMVTESINLPMEGRAGKIWDLRILNISE